MSSSSPSGVPGFAFPKSLTAYELDLKYSCDGRIIEGETYSPSLVIWRNQEKPEVVFIGRFSFPKKGSVTPCSPIFGR